MLYVRVCVSMCVYLGCIYSIRHLIKQSSSSSSSCRSISMDIPDTLSPFLPIVHCFRHVHVKGSTVVHHL